MGYQSASDSVSKPGSFKRDGDRPVSPDLVRHHVGELQQTRLAETPSRRPAH